MKHDPHRTTRGRAGLNTPVGILPQDFLFSFSVYTFFFILLSRCQRERDTCDGLLMSLKAIYIQEGEYLLIYRTKSIKRLNFLR